MPDKVFVDTNVLIYAYDRDAGPKRAAALERLRELWETRMGVLSTQVLQEFYVNVTRKIPSPLSPSLARDLLRDYCAWPIEVLDPQQVLYASELAEAHRLSFWDALIVAAALRGRASRILSEDLHSGQPIEGILIENPFAAS